MTCHDMEVLIISFRLAISDSPEAAAHIAVCESCGRLVRELEKGEQASRPSPEQLARSDQGEINCVVLPLAIWGSHRTFYDSRPVVPNPSAMGIDVPRCRDA
jgi:hypothetical protein